jgi:GH43 family beta-xylosidase
LLIKILLLIIHLLAALVPTVYPQSPAGTFTNPLVRSRDAADPWLVSHEGYYYFTATLDAEGGIWVWKSRTLAGLDAGMKVKVHTPDDKQRGRQMWAPELHFIDGRWYIYYTASDGVDENHRLYVLESRGRDPLGPYSFNACVYDAAHDGWAIDPSVLRARRWTLFARRAAREIKVAGGSVEVRVR